MSHRVPVVAYGVTAVPETLGDAGICQRDKQPTTVAAAVHRVLTDEALRTALATGAQERLAAMALPRSREVMTAALRSVVG
jgi:glycosyltransferase involved in cell wall biosynthesis